MVGPLRFDLIRNHFEFHKSEDLLRVVNSRNLVVPGSNDVAVRWAVVLNWLVLQGHASDPIRVWIELSWLSEWFIWLGQVQGSIFVTIRANPVGPKGFHFTKDSQFSSWCFGRVEPRHGDVYILEGPHFSGMLHAATDGCFCCAREKGEARGRRVRRG